MGCAGDKKDDILHYGYCKVFHRLLRSKLNLDPALFGNIHSLVLCNQAINTKERLASIALAIYAVYSVTNKARHGEAITQQVAYDALVQAVREGAKGHARSSGILRSNWPMPRPATSLPVVPLVPYKGQTARFWFTASTLGNKRPRS